MFYMMASCVVRKHVPSVKDFYERTVQSFSEVDFRKHIRSSCPTFHEKVREIGPIISKENSPGEKKPVVVEKQIMIWLLYLANTTTVISCISFTTLC